MVSVNVWEHEHKTEIDEWLRKERENAQMVQQDNEDKRESMLKSEMRGKANWGRREKRMKKEVGTGRFATGEENSIRKVKC